MTPCPARVVAVTRLMLDVLDDLGDQEMEEMSPAEGALAMLLVPHAADLRDILTQAQVEMASLAPPLLAEAYPAPG